MSDEEENQRPHEVSRERVVSSRETTLNVSRRKVIMDDDKDQPNYPPLFEQPIIDNTTFKEMEKISQEYVELFKEKYLTSNTFGRDELESLGDLVNSNFTFLNKGSGIATLAVLFEHYKKNHTTFQTKESDIESQRRLAEGLDCKLATVMAALILKELSALIPISLEVKLMLKGRDPHPLLRIDVSLPSGSESTYTLDFINRRPSPEKYGLNDASFKSNDERTAWEIKHGWSICVVNTPSAPALKRAESMYHSLPITVESLAELDQIFIRS